MYRALYQSANKPLLAQLQGNDLKTFQMTARETAKNVMNENQPNQGAAFRNAGWSLTYCAFVEYKLDLKCPI